MFGRILLGGWQKNSWKLAELPRSRRKPLGLQPMGKCGFYCNSMEGRPMASDEDQFLITGTGKRRFLGEMLLEKSGCLSSRPERKSKWNAGIGALSPGFFLLPDSFAPRCRLRSTLILTFVDRHYQMCLGISVVSSTNWARFKFVNWSTSFQSHPLFHPSQS